MTYRHWHRTDDSTGAGNDNGQRKEPDSVARPATEEECAGSRQTLPSDGDEGGGQ
jgi:hypothetical protein